ncbi:hypothetical protein SF83666_c23150 [Sinorhizobium fredii CCBAU 83666]|nr:hypothetical protein SF83666_c23150 [Sinorhizobium fredii CCBAU 83666]
MLINKPLIVLGFGQRRHDEPEMAFTMVTQDPAHGCNCPRLPGHRKDIRRDDLNLELCTDGADERF